VSRREAARPGAINLFTVLRRYQHETVRWWKRLFRRTTKVL